MERLKMESFDVVGNHVSQIAALFPNCVTERLDKDGNSVRAVDFEKLREELTGEIIEEGAERYQFTWPDKRKANQLANTPTKMTLRPCREESVDFDHTENLYIEGDNLEVLKVIREAYLGKVKMIYIDPPYNTGNDFVYNDDFASSYEEFAESCKVYDEEGNLTFDPKANGESNGRFHTDWLNMIYPRLKVARDLLAEDGVICVSIDDKEVENLKKICNEVFGEKNFEGHIHWRRRHNQPNDKTKMIGLVAEHIIVYAKNSAYLKQKGVGKLPLTAEFSNPDNDPNGPWASKPWKTGSDQGGSRYKITSPTGLVFDEEWMGDENTFNKYIMTGRIYFPKNGNGLPRKKYYQSEREEEGQCATNWWTHELFGHNQGANDLLTELFGRKNIFSNPKPIELILGLLRISNVKQDDLVLDFFSGSCSSAHAVMKLNAEDGGNRKFIMVQLPEVTDEKSEARKAGYPTICEIGKERIRRAGRKVKEEAGLQGQHLDVGFRVLKLAESNMEDVYYTPDQFDMKDLFQQADNVKPDRTGMDLLFQVMLQCGCLLSEKITVSHIGGKEVFSVADGYLIACFDKDVSEDVIAEIAKQQPVYFVMRDASAASDNVMDNFDQLFRHYSPDTIRRII
jgi:adenine-specific DNA-methyltransferase